MASTGFMSERYFAQHPRAVHHVARQQQVFAAGSRGDHVYGRVYALVGQLAVQLQLHVARTLELLEDHLVHFEPVSISAVAMIVSEPFSSVLRAAPKKRLGLCRALASTPPESTLPEAGCTEL